MSNISGSPVIHGTPLPPRHSTVSGRIKDLILTRGLRPGDPLPPESELQDIFGVSRTSVREAIRSLTTLGIVEVRHGHGTFVGSMSLDAMVETLVFRGVLSPSDGLSALKEIVEVRMHLDRSVAQEITTALKGTHDEELHMLVQQMKSLAALGQNFGDQDRLFHTRLLQFTKNNLITQMVGAFWDIHFAVPPQLGFTLPADMEMTVTAHEDMLRAAEDGDVVAYQEAVVKHYDPLLTAIAAI